MKPQSAKNKGRSLQKWTREVLLKVFPQFTSDDVRSTAMGQSGVDIQLSSAAKKIIPFSIECKNKARVAVYAWYKQASENSKGETPLVVIKQNHSEPLVVMNAEFFFTKWKGLSENK